MTAVTFTVPGSPVPWMRAASRAGVRFTPERQRQYQRLVADIARTKLIGMFWPLDARYSVTVRAVFNDARKRDIDNVQKQLLDACNGVAWNDDSQVDELHCFRAYGSPRMDVTITTLDAPAGAGKAR